MSRAPSFDELTAALRGSLRKPGDPGYDEARQVWNGMIDKHPSAIVEAAGVADVIATVNFARASGLPFAVRGGGHNVAGNAVCEGGVVLDLRRMRSVHVDPVRRTARVEGGATWRDYDHETQAHGLATPGGLVSSTGVGGLTLGGGFGYLSRLHGLASDNLVSVDVVTADGRLLIASADDHTYAPADAHADLFWGVRGGGGNFGVATSFKFRLHPVNGIYGGVIAFPADMAWTVFQRYREVAESAPDALTVYAALVPTPAGRATGIVVAFAGTEEEGRPLIQPLRDLGSVLLDTVAWMPYCQLQQQQDAPYPQGLRNYWKSSYLKGLGDDALRTLIDAMAQAPSPLCQIIIEQFGGAVARLPEDATAFPHRAAPYNVMILGIASDAADDAPNRAWVRQTWERMQPFSTGGAYVNYLDADEDVHRAYTGATYARLAALKRKYDPANLFRLNQNIAPHPA
jgi:FAD/FMN-containing dehydrogenase